MREHTITVYLTNDGTEYRRREDAERHERDAAAIAQAFADLPPRYRNSKNCEFENGAYYVQHRPGITGQVLWDRIRALPDAPHPRDCGDVWNSAYYRAQCVDNHGREWGQPYFTKHPNPDATPLDVAMLTR